MKVSTTFLALILTLSLFSLFPSIIAKELKYASILPTPTNITMGNEILVIYPDSFEIIIRNKEPNGILKRGVERYQNMLFPYTNSMLLEKENLQTGFSDLNLNKNFLKSLSIYVSSDTSQLSFPLNESYSLKIVSDEVLQEKFEISAEKREWRALLVADNAFGALRGLETFYQLVQSHTVYSPSLFSHPSEVGETAVGKYAREYYVVGAPISISDSPRFPWRGLLIDTARHYVPVVEILRQLDAMSFAKLNIFHWHITDEESFPFESKSHPNLTMGAWSEEQIYTHDDVAFIIDYARDRGIRVVPEIDLPGHCKSWSFGYPGIVVECWDGVDRYRHALNPLYPNVWKIVEDVYTEIASLFHDPFFHIGGDELRTVCWEKDEEISKWMESGESGVEGYFQLRKSMLFKLLSLSLQSNRFPIAWEEVLDVSPPLNTVIQAWRNWGVDAFRSSVKKGYKTILSTNWYLDWGFDWDFYYTKNKDQLEFAIDHPHLVLGGEAALWAERVHSSHLSSKIWPNTAGIAQLLWSISPSQNLTLVKSEIEEWACKAARRGVGSIPFAPHGCIDPSLLLHSHHFSLSNNNKNNNNNNDYKVLDDHDKVIINNDLFNNNNNDFNVGDKVVILNNNPHDQIIYPNHLNNNNINNNNYFNNYSFLDSFDLFFVILIFIFGLVLGVAFNSNISPKNKKILFTSFFLFALFAYLIYL